MNELEQAIEDELERGDLDKPSYTPPLDVAVRLCHTHLSGGATLEAATGIRLLAEECQGKVQCMFSNAGPGASFRALKALECFWRASLTICV